MNKDNGTPEFVLSDGPLYRLGRRLDLIRGGTNTVWLGIVLGSFAWAILMLLAELDGFGPVMFSLAATGVHVRLLVAIPLFFICETRVVFQAAEFTRYIVKAGLVEDVSLPVLTADVRRVVRMNTSPVPEAVFLVAAFVPGTLELVHALPFHTVGWVSFMNVTGRQLTLTSGWYLGFCLPLIRFLILRWIWILLLWCYFLWRLQKLDLRLIPIHSDGAAGLGYLEIVQERFTPLAAAISAILAAQFAEDIYLRRTVFEALYQVVPMVILVIAVLFIGPLFIFFRKLRRCRWTGMSAYMTLASRYVDKFDRKWVRGGAPEGEELLGTPDLQSLADLTNSVNVVSRMRLIPAGPRLILMLGAAAILPFIPLLLLKYPAEKIVERIFKILIGL